MKKIIKHIGFYQNNIDKIEQYAINQKMNFTEAVNELIDKCMVYEENAITSINKNSKSTKIVVELIYELLKQLYSDLSFPKLSNVKNSESLNEFLRKNRKIDD